MPAALPAERDAVTYDDVAVNGGTLRIALAGARDLARTPLILLHGWTLDHRMWQPQLAGLGDDHFLVMPDRRGHGRSTAPADLPREAEDVIAIADALGFDRFGLVGLSQGAVIALEVMRQYDARVVGAVVSGAPLPDLVQRDEVIELDTYRAWAAAGDMAALRRDWALHPLMQAHSREAHALLTAMLADYDGRDLLSPSDPPAMPRAVLGALTVPVLALAGEHDTPWRRACATALADAAPRAIYAQVPGAGHVANADNPDRFNALVGNFLRACADPETKA